MSMAKNNGGSTKVVTILIGVVAVAAAGYGATQGVCHFNSRRALTKAEDQLKKGFAALAADTLDKYRHMIVKRDRGCQVLLAAYYTTRNSEKLEWTAQACLEAGKETPDVFLGLAAVREMTGRDQDALRILNSALGKFESSPDLYYQMAQIFRRNRSHDMALRALGEASKRAPQNQQMVLEILEYTSSLGKWAEARKAADTLKSAKSDNPEIKLVMARAIEQGGDPSGAKVLVDEALGMLKGKDELKAQLERLYPDVFGDAPLPQAQVTQTSGGGAQPGP